MDRRDFVRRSDWYPQLVSHVSEVRALPFEEGRADCLRLVLGGVDAMTGSQLYGEHIGRYSNRFGALRYLVRLGFDRLDDYMRSLFPTVPVSQARIGDVAVGIDAQKGQHLCLMTGTGFETKMEQGQVKLLPGRILEAYSIGFCGGLSCR